MEKGSMGVNPSKSSLPSPSFVTGENENGNEDKVEKKEEEVNELEEKAGDKVIRDLTVDARAFRGRVVLVFSSPVNMVQFTPEQIDTVIKGLRQRRKEAIQQMRTMGSSSSSRNNKESN